MDVYLIRHAVAEPRGPGTADEDRALTEEGRERFSHVVRGLAEMGVRLDRLLTSPWRRALQTAEMAAEILDGEVEEDEELAAPPSLDLLGRIEGSSVGLVGHEPWMSELLAWLAFGDPGHAMGAVMKKGGVAWLRGLPRPGGMELRALIPPKVFRDLA